MQVEWKFIKTCFQLKSAVHLGKSTNMGTWKHAVAAVFDDGRWTIINTFAYVEKVNFLQHIVLLRGSFCYVHRYNVIVLVGAVLECVPAAPQSSIGEVQLSPDDGQELSDFKLRGCAGSTSSDRSLGLWT